MSFAKAKRFNYKDPEIRVSPADYNISGALEKGYSIPKCARFQEKKDEGEQTFVCSRLNCSRETHAGPCSPSVSEKQESIVGNVEEKKYNKNPQSSNTDASLDSLLYSTSSMISNKDTYPQQTVKNEKINKITNFERSRSVRKFSKRSSFKNSTPKIEYSENDTRPRSSSTESRGNNRKQIKHLIKNQQFIDDDYHSLTSSDDCEQLRKIDEYEYHAVRKAIQDIHNRKLVEEQSKFENIILKQMKKIESKIDEFKREFAQLNSKIQTEHLQKHDDLQSSKIKNATVYFDKYLNQVSNEKRAELKNIVTAAVENLRRELENKRKCIMRHNEDKIRKLMFEIQSTSNSSSYELKQLCDYTTSDLTKSLVSVLDTDNYEKNSDKVQHGEMENMDSSYCSSENHECFNYENICKVLSEHLQLTQDEKDALEKDNLDITLKYGDTKEALESQASLIILLQNEIAALKDHVYKKDN